MILYVIHFRVDLFFKINIFFEIIKMISRLTIITRVISSLIIISFVFCFSYRNEKHHELFEFYILPSYLYVLLPYYAHNMAIIKYFYPNTILDIFYVILFFAILRKVFYINYWRVRNKLICGIFHKSHPFFRSLVHLGGAMITFLTEEMILAILPVFM